jgi:hypothetical protein
LRLGEHVLLLQGDGVNEAPPEDLHFVFSIAQQLNRSGVLL